MRFSSAYYRVLPPVTVYPLGRRENNDEACREAPQEGRSKDTSTSKLQVSPVRHVPLAIEMDGLPLVMLKFLRIWTTR